MILCCVLKLSYKKRKHMKRTYVNFNRINNLASIKWSSSTYHMFKTTLRLPKHSTDRLQLYTEGVYPSSLVGFFLESQNKFLVGINLCSLYCMFNRLVG